LQQRFHAATKRRRSEVAATRCNWKIKFYLSLTASTATPAAAAMSCRSVSEST
jgi:hypothetical protein